MTSEHLTQLADIFGGYTGMSHWQMGLKAAGSAKFFRDLRERRRIGCTIATYVRVTQWLSDHWPADTPWPSDIPRPAPSSPASDPKEAA